IGGYQIVRSLGAGGLGHIYLGRDTTGAREYVTIKTAPAVFRNNKSIAERSENAARLQAGLRHPGIQRILEFGTASGLSFIVADYVPGATLSEWLRSPRWNLYEGALVIATIAETLAFVHANHVVHRDVKPSNIILTDTGRPVLLDFGLAYAE